MTVRIGTNVGQYDKGKMRIRATPTSASLLHVGEYGSGITRWNGAIATIVEEYAPWSVHPSYDTATSAWWVDLDPYTAQTRNFGPLALLGPPAVVWLDSGVGTASYVGDRSYSFTGAVSITSQSWSFPNGQTVSSQLGSSQNPIVITYTNASSGGRYHTLTVTDSNGASHIGQRLTFAFNSSNAQPQRVMIEEIAGGLNSGGYDGRIQAYSGATSDNFPEGAQIVIFEKASYNGIASSLGGNSFGRNNIVFVGWIVDDSTRIEPFTGNVSFRVATIDRVLAMTDAYDIFLEGGSAASAWTMASQLTIDKAALTLVKYRSTIGNVTDFNFAGDSASSLELAFRSLPQGNLWEQLRYNYEGVLGLLASDMQSSIYASLDSHVTGASASLPIIADIGAGDRRGAVVLEHPHFDENSQQTIYAIRAGVYTPIGGVSPSHRAGHFGGRQEISRNATAPDTDTAITWAGNLRAKRNNPYKRVNIPLSGNLRLDPVPQSRITMSLSPTGATNMRGLNWNNQSLVPYEMRVSYNPISALPEIDITAESVVDGHGGSSVDFPPLITPPTPGEPNPGGAAGKIAALIAQAPSGSNDIVARTTNFLASNPSWKNITNNITFSSEAFTDLVFDPYNLSTVSWIATTKGNIWKTTSLNQTTPIWTRVLTGAQIEAGFGGTLASPTIPILSPSIASSGYWALLVQDNAAAPQIGVTSNNGSTWSWATIAVSYNSQGEVVYSNHSISNLFFLGSNSSTATTAYVYMSSNGGGSWSSLSFPAASGYAVSLYLPYSGNDNDQIIYVSTTTGVFKTENQGASWSNITPSRYSKSSPPGSNRKDITGDGNTIYVSDEKSVFKTIDGGATWVLVNPGLTLGYHVKTWINNYNRLYIVYGTDSPRYSSDGGSTFQNKTGDFENVFGNIGGTVNDYALKRMEVDWSS